MMEMGMTWDGVGIGVGMGRVWEGGGEGWRVVVYGGARRRGVGAREERSYGLPPSTFECEQSTLK